MRITLLMFLIIIILFVTGCTAKNDNTPVAEGPNNDRIMRVKNSSPTVQKDFNNTEIANHLAHIAADVPDVNAATAVVAGPYVVVGIDVDKDIDRSRVGTIKYSVAEALYHDPYGKTAVVVADADTTERIRGMADKIEQGYPVHGIVDELAAIVGRFMPELPISPNQPVEPDQNKETLPHKDRNKLNEIEQEQSNHQMNH